MVRISGMYSGMDTDTIVKDLMKVEQMKVTKVERQKQLALWKQEAYNSTNKLFANFIINSRKNLGISTSGSNGSILINSYNYSRLDYVKKATSSNETIATVSSTAAAVNGSYQIEVKELADSAKYTSAKLSKDDLNDLDNMGELNINGVKIEVTKQGNSISMTDIVKSINSAKDADGKAIGITAFFDESNGRLFLQGTDNVKNPTIEITGGDLANKLNKTIFGDPNSKIMQPSKKAKINFNGAELEYDSNNISLNGMNISLNSAAEGQKITLKVDTNVDGIMDKVKQFVTDYNALVDQLSKSVNEKKYSSYYPLSSEEKSAMNEEDAKLWTEKSKSGMLNRDETLNRVLQNVRTGLYEKVEGAGAFNHITQIGITTEKYSRGTTGGKLEIDEDKLRAEILKDPESVMNLLFKEESQVQAKDKDGNLKVDDNGEPVMVTSKGLVTRMFDNITDGMKSIIEKSGTGGDSDLLRNVKSNILIDFVTKKSSISDMDKSITEMNKKIDQLNVWLAKKEESYYSKFTAMEKYMQQMSSQSSWIGQQMR